MGRQALQLQVRSPGGVRGLLVDVGRSCALSHDIAHMRLCTAHVQPTRQCLSCEKVKKSRHCLVDQGTLS